MGFNSAYPFRLFALELRRTMSKMKLTYFNLMGRAETTRLILAQAGVAFEDKRIEPAEWPALKASLPMGQLPILEVDGKTIGQSMTIARFCGRRFGLAGKDELEGALADQAVDQVADFLAEVVKAMREPEETKKAEMGKQLKADKLPAFLASMEKLLKSQGGKHFAGSGLTWADIVVYQFISSMKVARPNQPKALVEEGDLTNCPALCALVAMVGGLPNIKKWEQTRPVTPM